MDLTQGETVAITGGITQRQQFGPPVAAMEQQGTGLRFAAPGTLTRRHDPEGTEGV